jgi:hypothetical protein
VPRGILLRLLDIRDAVSGIQDVSAGATFDGSPIAGVCNALSFKDLGRVPIPGEPDL